MNDKPYYVHEVKTPPDGYYCHLCEQWHCKDPRPYAPEPRQHFYNVCVGDVCLPVFRSCSAEYCQQVVDQYNTSHVRIRERSITQGHKPVLI